MTNLTNILVLEESVGADTVEELKYSSSIKKDSDFKAIFWKDLKEFNISPSLTGMMLVLFS